MTGRTYTMRELLTQARERFGADAGRYKTRQELLVALGLAALPVEPQIVVAPPPPRPALVVKDFFVSPEKP